VRFKGGLEIWAKTIKWTQIPVLVRPSIRHRIIGTFPGSRAQDPSPQEKNKLGAGTPTNPRLLNLTASAQSFNFPAQSFNFPAQSFNFPAQSFNFSRTILPIGVTTPSLFDRLFGLPFWAEGPVYGGRGVTHIRLINVLESSVYK
jgi:hypothetical protein